MIYRAFLNGTVQQIADIQDAGFPLLKAQDRIPIIVDGKESLYTITEVGVLSYTDDRLVVDIWVDPPSSHPTPN